MCLWTIAELTRRTKKVAELIRHELGRVLTSELDDPRIGFVTLTRVEVTPDFRTARAYVSILGSAADERTALRGLNSARGRMRAALGNCLTLRCVPDLTFCVDPGVKHSIRIGSLLSDLAREREADGNDSTPGDSPERTEDKAEEHAN